MKLERKGKAFKCHRPTSAAQGSVSARDADTPLRTCAECEPEATREICVCDASHQVVRLMSQGKLNGVISRKKRAKFPAGSLRRPPKTRTASSMWFQNALLQVSKGGRSQTEPHTRAGGGWSTRRVGGPGGQPLTFGGTLHRRLLQPSPWHVRM